MTIEQTRTVVGQPIGRGAVKPGEAEAPSAKIARQFRQILVWPLQLMPLREDQQIQRHWEELERLAADGTWRPVEDEITGDPEAFEERHYREFITFLPHVRRFLYGDVLGTEAKPGLGDSPVRPYRRSDVRRVRVTLTPGRPPVLLDIAHTDLYFFYDLDIVVMVLEVFAADLALDVIQELLFRFGRAYPSGWTEAGEAAHSPHRVEWLDAGDQVVARSDYENKRKYLASVCRHRAVHITADLEYLLKPMVPVQGDLAGPLRYRLIEHFRMPFMAFLAMADIHGLSRGDYVRLALGRPAGPCETLPFSERSLEDFEAKHCYDRFHERTARPNWTDTRFLATGQSFLALGDGNEPFVTDPERGLLGQFRHQYFILFLIAHFHKAALLMLSNRLVETVKKLDIDDPASVRRFRTKIRRTLEIFLRFTHRYWFHDLSDQAQAHDLFRMLTRHLGTDGLYHSLREAIRDMSDYLDSDTLRKQSNTMLRLTVVTILSLVGVTTTGIIGMNVIDATEETLLTKIAYIVLALVPVTILTFYTIIRSHSLSEFLDVLSDERVPIKAKWNVFLNLFLPKAWARSIHGGKAGRP